MTWFKCEYFYSWIDRAYFSRNELKDRLSDIGISDQAKFTNEEWGFIRAALRQG